MSQLKISATPDSSDHAPAPLPFERRQTDRWPLRSTATAFRLGGNEFGRMHELKVLDYSYTGLGAVSNTVLEPGTRVSVGFSAPGCIAKRGTVLRCTPCGSGYRIAIEFDARLAA